MQETKTKNRMNLLDRVLLIGSKDEKSFIVENLAMMLSAGLSIPAALESILGGLRNETLIKMVKGIKTDTDEGSTLHRALAKTSLLPSYALSLIKIGEESGNLTQNLQVIAAEQQKESALNSKIHSAMIYPILVLSITLLVGLSVAWFILPNLANVFTNLKLELPSVTKILMYFSSLLSHQGYWLVPVLTISLFFIIYFVFFNPRTNRIGQYLLFALPITKRLIVNLELSRLGYVLSSLLAAGIPIKETMKLLEESSSSYRYKEFYSYLGEGLEVGNSFKTSFAKYPNIDQLIPPPIQQVIISGEQSGKLSQSLLLVSNRFEQKTEENIKNLPVILEPVFLIIIWVGVLLVALAVILPIYSLVGNLNNPF